jgi:acyl-CoA synthetase (AMP-forming)/AMP-acid ligase II
MPRVGAGRRYAMLTVSDLFDRNARYFPEREAFVCDGRRLTHAGYASRARRLASALSRLGLRRQDRVAILAMNCLEYYEAYAAAEYGATILVPLNFRLAPPEIVHVLRDSGARGLIFEERYAATVAQIRPQLPDVGFYVQIGAAADGALEYEALVTDGDEAGPPLRPQPHDYSVLWYTSGTTGKPKGVPWRHRALVETARMNARQSEMSRATRLLQTTPSFHIGGRGYVLGTAYDGGCTVLHKAFDPVAMLRTIQDERITHTFMVAAMVQAVLAAPDVQSYDLSSLENIFSAAAPIPAPVLRRAIELMGPVFSIQYGCTEVGGICAMPRMEVRPDGTPDDVRRLASVGHPVSEIEFRLVDDHGRDCPPGTPGEVVVRSATQLDGYWNNTAASLDAIRDGWYYTGDIGLQDEQGYVFLVDRKKDMIISGGENIYSREVEEAIAAHPEVVDCAVIGVADPKWVEVVKAVVVRRNGGTLTEQTLIEHCRTLIARYKCPRSVDFVDELPRLATGKLDKPSLRARYRQ